MNPVLRDRLTLTVAVMVALFVGVKIAVGAWLWPGLLVLGLGLVILLRLKSDKLEHVIIGGLLAGYLIGNRGFAQFMLLPTLPLLPGEAALVALCVLQVLAGIRSGMRWRPQAMDWFIAAWIVFGIARMSFDARIFGIVAVRDFATVYYAVFFYLTANAVRDDTTKINTLLGILRIASVVMAGLFFFSRTWSGVLESTLTFRGIPLIFYKDDLVGVFASVGAILHFIRFEETRRTRSLAFSILLIGIVVLTNNRSAMLALFVGAMALWVGGRWRFITFLGIGAVVASVFIAAVASWRGDSWRDTPLVDAYERVISIFDPLGTGSYEGSMTASKGDNNRFRLVWWQEVAGETWDKSPIFGLGFGHDLAAEFLQEYYGLTDMEFTARSPHSIVVTVFARMGIFGVTLFVIIIGLMFSWIWKTSRSPQAHDYAPPIAAVMIFTSSCFGVVMEGPMGAVVFWILLGVSRSRTGDLTQFPEESDSQEEGINTLPNTAKKTATT